MRLLLLALVVAALAGCDAQPPAPPSSAAKLAADLTASSSALRHAIAAWRRDGDPRIGDAPPLVVGLAAHVQRIHRTLATHKRLAHRTLKRLKGTVRARARSRRRSGAARPSRPTCCASTTARRATAPA